MKKFLLFFTTILLACQGLVAQNAQTAYKPTIMVFPAEDWCLKMGYVNQGGGPDYERALMDDNMSSAISAISDIMAERKYDLTSLKATLDQIKEENALDMTLTSRDGKGEIVEDDTEKLLRKANADIKVDLSLKVTPYGPRRMIEFRVESIDAASRKSIQGSVGTSTASSAPMSQLVNEVVGQFMDNFCARINQHFAQMEKNGREATLIFKMADDSPMNFEEIVTVDGESGELAEFIDYWISEHTVNGAYSPGDKARNRVVFNQVRMPLFSKVRAGGFGSKKGKMTPQSAEKFVAEMRSTLDKLGLSMSSVPLGVGRVVVTLGSSN